MRIPNIRLLVLLSMLICLTGCWTQQDIISIRPDGTTSFRSEVVITEKGFTVKELDQLCNEFMKELIGAGWKVEKQWLSRAEPFRLAFVGKGNIRSVKSAPDFYLIQKINDRTFAIRFVSLDSSGVKNSRSIRFERSFFAGWPRILDERGSEVREIETVRGNRLYRIMF